jgi:hypothetical protein
MAVPKRRTASSGSVRLEEHEKGGYAVYVDDELVTRSASPEVATAYAEQLGYRTTKDEANDE